MPCFNHRSGIFTQVHTGPHNTVKPYQAFSTRVQPPFPSAQYQGFPRSSQYQACTIAITHQYRLRTTTTTLGYSLSPGVQISSRSSTPDIKSLNLSSFPIAVRILYSWCEAFHFSYEVPLCSPCRSSNSNGELPQESPGETKVAINGPHGPTEQNTNSNVTLTAAMIQFSSWRCFKSSSSLLLVVRYLSIDYHYH